ncbi:MAG TPA: superoxide dismutase [Bacteroidetes bacterium]|nr:superoxide dismutase [Bacteroidota bacterium]
MLATASTSTDSTRIAVLQAKINALEDDDVHCEVPCGIYGDSLRIQMIEEHIRTIEKAMNKINEISKSDSPNYNQLVRWVMNKEEHAKKIQHIVSQYFLHQRIKLTDPANAKKYARYVKHLTHLHEIAVYAMKCKQTTDLKNIVKIKTAVDDFERSYFHSHK